MLLLLLGASSGGVTPPVTQPEVGGGRFVAHSFTRKKWRELIAAIASERTLEAQAAKAQGDRRVALEQAAQAARAAIAAVEEEETAED